LDIREWRVPVVNGEAGVIGPAGFVGRWGTNIAGGPAPEDGGAAC